MNIIQYFNIFMFWKIHEVDTHHYVLGDKFEPEKGTEKLEDGNQD